LPPAYSNHPIATTPSTPLHSPYYTTTPRPDHLVLGFVSFCRFSQIPVAVFFSLDSLQPIKQFEHKKNEKRKEKFFRHHFTIYLGVYCKT
jgi:hypothetical protein